MSEEILRKKARQERIQEVRKQEKERARSYSETFQAYKLKKEAIDRLDKLVRSIQANVYNAAVKEIEELNQQKQATIEILGQAQKEAVEEGRRNAQAIHEKLKKQQEDQTRASSRGRKAIQSEVQSRLSKETEEQIWKYRREEIKRQEIDRAQKVAQDSRERQRILAELEAKAKMDSYIPPGGIVVKGTADFKNTHFHNPVIVKHDMENKTAADKAQEERMRLQELINAEARIKIEMQERAKARGQQALSTELVEKQMGTFINEIEKFRKADGYDKIQKGKQGAPTQNRCYIKDSSTTQNKQKKLEQIFEKMFEVEPSKTQAKETALEAPKPSAIKIPEPQLPLHIKEKLVEDPFQSVRKNLTNPHITHKAPIRRNRVEIPTPQSTSHLESSSEEESEYNQSSSEEEKSTSQKQEESLEVSFESELNEDEALVKKPKYYVNEAPSGSWKNYQPKESNKMKGTDFKYSGGFEIKPEHKFLPKNIENLGREEYKQDKLDSKIDKIFQGQKDKPIMNRLDIPDIKKEIKSGSIYQEFDSFSEKKPIQQYTEIKTKPLESKLNKAAESKYELYEPKFEEYQPLVHSKPNILYEDLKTDFIQDASKPHPDISKLKTVKSNKLYEPTIEEYVPSYDPFKPKPDEFTPKFEKLPMDYEEDKNGKSELSEDFMSLLYSDSKKTYQKDERVDIDLQFLQRKPVQDSRLKDFLKFDKDSSGYDQRSAVSSSKKDSQLGVSDLFSSKEHSAKEVTNPKPEKRKAWAVDISDLKEMREKQGFKYEPYEQTADKYKDTKLSVGQEDSPKDEDDWFSTFKKQDSTNPYERKPAEKIDWMTDYKYNSESIEEEVRQPPRPQERKQSWAMEFDMGDKTVKQDSDTSEQAENTLRSDRAKPWKTSEKEFDDLKPKSRAMEFRDENPRKIAEETKEDLKPRSWAMEFRDENPRKIAEETKEDFKPKSWAMEYRDENLRTVSKDLQVDSQPKGWAMDFTEEKAKSVSDMFLEKKRKLAEKLITREEIAPKQLSTFHKEKTKEELIKIRKEMLKPKKSKKVGTKYIAFEIPNDSSKKDLNSYTLSRLATGGKPKVTQKEAKELALKNYKQLPEIVKKREDEEKKRAIKDRLTKMKNFDKSVQNKRMKQQQRKYLKDSDE